MKHLLPKFKIYTLIYIGLCFYFKWYKETILLFVILLFHEYAHVIMAYVLKYKIEQIVIYPFGAFMNISDYGYHEIKEDLWVAMAGLCSHLFLLLLAPLFCRLFNKHMTNYYIHFNLQILLFNLLPIYPLDGGKIMLCLLSYFFDYLKSLKLTLLFSFIHLFLLILFNFDVKCIFVYLFLFIQVLDFYNHYYYMYMGLLLCRKENKKRKPILNKKNVFYKNRENYYLKKGAIIDEKTAIKSGFFIDKATLWW